MNTKLVFKQIHDESVAESKSGEKPQRDLIFMVYPPNEFISYYHYRNGLRAWGDCDPASKMALIMSIISLIIAIIKCIWKL